MIETQHLSEGLVLVTGEANGIRVRHLLTAYPTGTIECQGVILPTGGRAAVLVQHDEGKDTVLAWATAQ